jgi:YD repeat-containing protein
MRISAALGPMIGAMVLVSPAASQTTQTYGYDAHGRLVSATVAIGAHSGGAFTHYGLDAADNRTGKYAEPIPALAASDRLAIVERLAPGQTLVSSDSRFTFVLQGDGNAVIYGLGSGLWSTNTYGSQATVLAMQTDGNLELWNASGRIWQSGTSGHPGAHLVMQSDGNLVIFDGATPIWSTGTGGH